MTDVKFDMESVKTALLHRAETLRSAIEVRIQKKLSGEVLQSVSGTLAASIMSSIEDVENGVTGVISSSGVPYAAIQEFGGKTAAHDIVSVKAKALAFNMGENQDFARSVHHPGSTIPSRSYLKSSLTEIHDEIEYGFKEAIIEALRQ